MRSSLLVASMCALSACLPEVSASDGGTDAGGNSTFDAGHTDAGTDAGVLPLKLVFLFDGSQSLTITDPNGERAAALVALMNQLPQDPNISVSIMIFAGSTIATLSPSGLQEFTALPDWSSNERNLLTTRLTTFVPPGMTNNDVDWVRGLEGGWTLIYQDAMSALTNGTPKAKYVVFFVSDGRPTNEQDGELLCGDAVARIRNLRLYAADVFVNTIHLFKPSQSPTCTVDAGLTIATTCQNPIATNSGCASIEVELDAQRLRQMATLGGGQFRDFRAGQAVSFAGLIPP